MLLKKTLFITLLLLTFSCSENISENQLALLNGYWEIEKVTFSDGQTKEYTVNESIDFIKIDKLKGYRKKVKPTFNGTYITNDDAEPFTIFKKEDQFLIHYKSAIDERSETIKSISETNFSVTNSDNITYTYKKYEPINITK